MSLASFRRRPEDDLEHWEQSCVRNFRLLWIGQGISVLGDQFYLIALPWLVLQLTGDALAVGTVLALVAFPRAVFMLVGGALIDRFSPPNVMLASDALRMVLVTGILAAVLSLLAALNFLRRGREAAEQMTPQDEMAREKKIA